MDMTKSQTNSDAVYMEKYTALKAETVTCWLDVQSFSKQDLQGFYPQLFQVAVPSHLGWLTQYV